MRVGISTACFYPSVNTEDTLDIIKDSGFDLCEVFLEAQCEMGEYYCGKLREKSERLGLDIYSVHAFNGNFEPYLFDKYERRRHEMEMKFRDVCRAASILGAKYYTFHGITSNMPRGNIEEVAMGMNKLCRVAEEYKINLSWENVSWCMSGNPEFLKDIDEKIYEKLYFTLDIKQALRSKHYPNEYIDIYGKRLSTVHINDAGIDGTCLMPGRGNLKLKEIVDKVKNIDENIPFIIEVYRENFKAYDELSIAREYLYNIV
jgi:sugar phosphate isomerase/epimerase